MRISKAIFVTGLLLFGFILRYWAFALCTSSLGFGSTEVQAYFDVDDPKLTEIYTSEKFSVNNTNYVLVNAVSSKADVIITTEEKAEDYKENGYTVQEISSYVYVVKLVNPGFDEGYDGSTLESVGTSKHYYKKINLAHIINTLVNLETPDDKNSKTVEYELDTYTDLGYTTSSRGSYELIVRLPINTAFNRQGTMETILYNLMDGKSPIDLLKNDPSKLDDVIDKYNTTLDRSTQVANIKTEISSATERSILVVPEIFLKPSSYREYTEHTVEESLYACYKSEEKIGDSEVSVSELVQSLIDSKVLTEDHMLRNMATNNNKIWMQNPNVVDYREELKEVFGDEWWKADSISVVYKQSSLNTEGGPRDAGTYNS